MTVILMEKVPPSLRGEISKWLIELKAGVFVGKINALVREFIWEKCTKKAGEGSVVMVWKTNNEQGFDIKHHKTAHYHPENFEGVWLVRRALT